MCAVTKHLFLKHEVYSFNWADILRLRNNHEVWKVSWLCVSSWLSFKVLIGYTLWGCLEQHLNTPAAVRDSASLVSLIGHFQNCFLPERDYVTFGSLLSQFRLSVVCNIGAPYSRGWSLSFGNFSSPLCCVRWPSSDLRAKFYGYSFRGTPLLEALNARGVSKYSDFGPIEGYIS